MTDWSAITQTFVDNLGLHRRPIGVHYQDTRPDGAIGFKKPGRGCLVALLKRVEDGKVVALSSEQSGCPGGRFYCGFAGEPFEGQAEYVSTGIPGQMEGEHYLQTPELCRRVWREYAPLAPAAEWIVFQRLDTYAEGEEPEVVAFFARPDSIGGLHFLACYDRGVNGVIAPFASGCGALVTFPRIEANQGTHRAVLGLFDPSARYAEDPQVLTFAVDVARFLEMAANIDESFLQYEAWSKIKQREHGR